MPQIDIYKQLCNSEIYTEVFEYLRNRVKKEPDLKFKAPVEKSLSLSWCLNEEALITRYLVESSKDQSYQPGKRKAHQIQADKKRTILTSHWVDKIFEYAFGTILYKNFSSDFSDNLYSYRKNYSNRLSIQKLQSLIAASSGTQPLYLFKSDIKSYTDTIDIELLMQDFEKLLGSQSVFVWKCMREILQPMLMTEAGCTSKRLIQGIPTGSYLSNFAANLYLSGLDNLISQQCLYYSRYGDDLLLADTNANQLKNNIRLLSDNIKLKKLQLNQQKTSQLVLFGPDSSEFKAVDRIRHLGFVVYDNSEIFLTPDKFRQTKKQFERHLLQVKQNSSHFSKSREETLQRMIKASNLLIKNYALIKYLPDIIRFCNNNKRIEDFDHWIANTIISLLYGNRKRSSMRKVSYGRMHDLGLLTVQNFKNFYDRKDEVLKNFSCE